MKFFNQVWEQFCLTCFHIKTLAHISTNIGSILIKDSNNTKFGCQVATFGDQIKNYFIT